MATALKRGLRNIQTMTNKTHKQHNLSPHEALIRAAAIVREQIRHTQELKVLESRINEINLRLVELNAEQDHLMTLGVFEKVAQAAVVSKTPGSMIDQGFKIKY